MAAVGRRAFLAGGVGLGVGLGSVSGRARANTQPSPVVWTAESGGTVRDYLVADEDVYVGTDQNRLRRLRRATGEERGLVELPAGVYPGGITATTDHVVVATDDDRLSVYERSALAGSDATPVWEPPLSGQPVGMDAHDGAVVVATRDGLVALEPPSQGFRWQRYTDDLDFEFFGPPLAWNDAGIVVSGGTTAVFVSPESGEIEVRVDYGGPDYVDRPSEPPAAVVSAGPYVGYSGDDAFGSRAWATVVIDTERRDVEYGAFSGGGQQKSIGLTETTVVHNVDEDRIVFATLDGEDEFRLNLSPRFDGIASTDSRTFVADGSAESAGTRLVAVENEGYGEAWSHAFDEPVAYLETAGDLLFGVNEAEGRLLALSRTGDRTDVVGTPTAAGSGDGTAAGGATSTAGDGAGAASQGSGTAEGRAGGGDDAGGDPPRRGFFTNGEDPVLSGIGLTGASTVITVAGILVTLVDMLQGDGN